MNGVGDGMNKETLERVKIMYKLYVDKYEEACIYRDNEKAIRYAGYWNGLELLLLGVKQDEFVQKIRNEVQERRNKVVELWKSLK